ncbi:MAG: hypothetical protein PVF97_00605, partial [Desulfobacterales bacterium]
RVIQTKIQELYQGKLYQTVIPLDGRLREAQIMSMPVHHYDAQSRSGQAYTALANEIMEPADHAKQKPV